MSLMSRNLIDIALTQYGVREIAGQKDNPKILKYFTDLGFDGKALTEETAWCAAFVGWCVEKSLPWVIENHKLNARSFLDHGVEVVFPQVGDIVVLWRESPTSWKGHLGFWINQDENHVWLLGGNQDNMVCIKPYPVNQILGFRRFY